MKRTNRNDRRRRGMVVVLALVLLILFAAMAVAYAAFNGLNFQQSVNNRDITAARLSAESGLSFMLYAINPIRLPATTTQETMPAALTTALGEHLNGSTNLGAQIVSSDGTSVIVPTIALSEGTFSCRFTPTGADTCRLTVRGVSNNVSRTITIDLKLTATRSQAFDYGLASRGKISISGNAEIVGVNALDEASVLSATASESTAIAVDGGVTISGDLIAAGDDTEISITGSPTIAGSTDPNVIAQHVHLGADVPDFPEVDTSALTALATYTLQPTDPTNKGVLNNVRIPANTNPTFSSDIILNGIVYIEAPNNVTFTAKTTLNGLVVTEDDPDVPISECQINFGGHVDAFGVDALPDTAEFSAVKEQTGTFVLAPGFGVTFSGNFSAVNGTIAADQLTFTGTAEGVVKGSVIGLEDYQTFVSGNVDIYVDKTNADPSPAGFVQPFALVPQPNTYTEVSGQ